MKGNITNWSLYPKVYTEIHEPRNLKEVIELILNKDNLIVRGNGKCYGDASLSKNIISTIHLNKIIALDSETGIIRCEAGVLLSTILELIVPKGYFLPVTPGTKLITIGGAFASDIHGKNHHVEGVFSDHVTEIKLVNANGEIVTSKSNEDLFLQTAGGLGLTGCIIEVSLKLKKIETSYIKQTSIKAKNLEEIFNLFEENKHFTYSVAWIDCLARGKDIGKSILLLGEHATMNELNNIEDKLKLHQKPFLNVPFYFPSFFLNSFFIKLFNKVYYLQRQGTSIVHYDPYFYPLDKINNWNKIYGKRGFVQYQFVLPKEQSFEGVKSILDILSKNNLGSFLAVLKLFGRSHEDRYLEFPIEGYTLAVDIKITDSLWGILDELDEIVDRLGGKIYLTKDARMSHESFEKQYKNKIQLSDKFQSHQLIRLNNMYQKCFLIIGANSDIAKATALAFLKKNSDGHLILASRDTNSLKEFVVKHRIEEKVEIIYYDVTATAKAKEFVKSLPSKPKWVMYAAGVLFENGECITSIEKNNQNIAVNYLGGVAIINEIVEDNNPNLERIIGISSIAGLRGRKSNYFYGAAKSGFHQYLFGLRQDLKERGVIVQAITPGVVNTKMTEKLNKPGVAVNPEIVANSIIKNKSSFEVYPNLIWYLISRIVKYAPEFIIKKL